MPTLTIEYETDAERLMLEQAVAFVGQMRHVAATAPAGSVMDACEQLALADGRRLLCDALAAAVHGRTAAVDAKKKSPAPGPRGAGRGGC